MGDLERPAMNNHSSLFNTFISYGEKKDLKSVHLVSDPFRSNFLRQRWHSNSSSFWWTFFTCCFRFPMLPNLLPHSQQPIFFVTYK